MLIYQNVEGVHGQIKFGNTCPKPAQQRQTINESVGCFDWFLTWFMICMETSEIEYEQNGERERTVAQFHC